MRRHRRNPFLFTSPPSLPSPYALTSTKTVSSVQVVPSTHRPSPSTPHTPCRCAVGFGWLYVVDRPHKDVECHQLARREPDISVVLRRNPIDRQEGKTRADSHAALLSPLPSFPEVRVLDALVALVAVVVVRFVVLLVLARHTPVGLLAVEVGEDEVKDLRVPACWTALNAFFDVLQTWLVFQ